MLHGRRGSREIEAMPLESKNLVVMRLKARVDAIRKDAPRMDRAILAKLISELRQKAADLHISHDEFDPEHNLEGMMTRMIIENAPGGSSGD